MFPLLKRKLRRGATAHVAAGLGVGADYEAVYITDYVPFDGVLKNYWGSEGGNWCRITRPNGDKIEMAHHSKYLLKNGPVQEGQPMAITGNTGSITTDPHLHIQIIRNGKRLDPETYNWETLNKTFMKITVVTNKISWDVASLLPQLSEWFKTYSSNRLEPVFDIKQTDFDAVPLTPFQTSKAVDVDWYRQNVTPLATGQMTLFVLNPDQYDTSPSNTWGFMTYGDPQKPVRSEISCYDDPNYPEAHLFIHRAFHEICHGLFFLTGQPDKVHELLLVDQPKRKELLDLIDYSKLQTALNTIKPTTMNQAKIVKSKNSNTVYICYPVPSEQHLAERVSLEGMTLPNPIPNTDTL